LKPSQLRNGGRIEELTSCRDWLPTFVDWCGLKSKGTQFDGRSLTALIEQPSSDWPERTLFVQRQGDQPTPDAASSPADRFPHFAVLTEQWRFVDGELFSIRNDRSQKTNVAVQFPQVVRELRGRYEEHFRDVFPDRSDYARFQVGSLDENPTLLTVRDWHPTVGRVIWKQSQLGDAAIEPNGFWAIHVARSGKYKIQLSRFPNEGDQSKAENLRAEY
jgi:uncharacterized sulfatase